MKRPIPPVDPPGGAVADDDAIPPAEDDPGPGQGAAPEREGMGRPRFEGALRLAVEAFWRWDRDTDKVQLSEGWDRIFGPEGGPTGNDWRRRVHEEDRPKIHTGIQALIDGKEDEMSLECRIRHSDRGWRWMRLRATAEKDANGVTGAIVGTILDITAQHRTHDVFERLVRHNTVILNAAGDGIYCLDENGSGTFVNPAAARMLGEGVGHLTGVPLCRFRPGCSLRQGLMVHDPACPIDATLRTGLPHRVYDGRFMRTDGAVVPVEYVVSPIRERDRITGAVVVFNDVTERRWSEEQIRRERRFSDGLIKSSIDGIVTFDRDLRYTIWNPAMERISGLTATEMIGRTIGESFPFPRDTGGDDDVAATLDGATITVQDRAFSLEETGRGGFYEARFAPLYDEDGEILGGLGIVHDTTRKKSSEEEVRAARQKLVRSEKLAALGTLVSGVGHELRTPMSYINNHLYLLKMLGDRMKTDDPDMSPIAEEIIRRSESSLKGIQRMATLLDDLRATYRNQEAEVKEADLCDVVQEAVRLFSGAYEGPVQIKSDLSPTGPLLLEAGRLQQVVINLLNNAAEAMPDGGQVEVIVRSEVNGAELIVRDEGSGMDEQVRASVFTPFYTTKRDGSGLGLYLVKQIIDRHLGAIECESAPGNGTMFRVFLPHRSRVDLADVAAKTDRPPAELEAAMKEKKDAANGS